MEKMTAQEIEQKRAGEKETVGLHDRHLLPRSARDEAGRTLRGVRQLQAYADLRTGKMPVYGDEDVLQCL